MSLRGAVWGTKMLKLNIVIVILLISIGTVHARGPPDGGSCSGVGEIWVLHEGGISTGDFNLGEDVYLGGADFDPGEYYFKILDESDDLMEEGKVTANEFGDIIPAVIWTIPPGAIPGDYTVEVREGMCGMGGMEGCCGDVATAEFTIVDPTTEIPEYPTVMIPAIMAFGGYMAIRSRRKGK